MKLFGLTGGIACGKSTVSDLLRREHGVRIVDCDVIVRDLQGAGSAVVRSIAKAFPDDNVVDPVTLELRREVLSALVFRDPAKRRRLAKVMNGAVFRAIFVALIKAWWSSPGNGIVVLDAPLLFETGVFTWFCSAVIVVGCTSQTQISRLASRNGYDREAALQRISAQMAVETKMAKGDFVIRNEGTLATLTQDVADAVRWMSHRSTAFDGWNRAFYGSILAACAVIGVAIRFVASSLK